MCGKVHKDLGYAISPIAATYAPLAGCSVQNLIFRSIYLSIYDSMLFTKKSNTCVEVSVHLFFYFIAPDLKVKVKQINTLYFFFVFFSLFLADRIYIKTIRPSESSRLTL